MGERKRIQIIKCAEKVGYIPKQSYPTVGLNKIIAIILGDIRNPFYTDLVFHMQEELAANGYMTMVFNNEYDVDREKKFAQNGSGISICGLDSHNGSR